MPRKGENFQPAHEEGISLEAILAAADQAMAKAGVEQEKLTNNIDQAAQDHTADYSKWKTAADKGFAAEEKLKQVSAIIKAAGDKVPRALLEARAQLNKAVKELKANMAASTGNMKETEARRPEVLARLRDEADQENKEFNEAAQETRAAKEKPFEKITEDLDRLEMLQAQFTQKTRELARQEKALADLGDNASPDSRRVLDNSIYSLKNTLRLMQEVEGEGWGESRGDLQRSIDDIELQATLLGGDLAKAARSRVESNSSYRWAKEMVNRRIAALPEKKRERYGA